MSAELGLAWPPAPLGPITHRLASPTIQARAGHVRVVFFFGKCIFLSGPLLNKMGQFKFYRNILLRRQCKSATEDLPPNQNHIVFGFALILIMIRFAPMLAQDVFIQTQHTHKVWPHGTPHGQPAPRSEAHAPLEALAKDSRAKEHDAVKA